jgi:ornithine carbamoyltransferase
VAQRIRLLEPYRVTTDLMRKTGNPHAKSMHGVPAFHNSETKIGAEIARESGIDCMDAASIVFDQAENRLYTFKAILVATLGA